jgi:hypothetical protein
MVVGEHGVEEKVVVSREEVVAMAIPPQISVVWQRGEGEQHLLRRSSATHASELTRGDQGEAEGRHTPSSPLVARAWSFRIWILSVLEVW